MWTYNPLDEKNFSDNSKNLNNSIGLIGAYLSYFSYLIFGLTAWVLIIPTFLIPIKYLFTERSGDAGINLKKIVSSALGFFLSIFSIATLISIHLDPYKEFFPSSSAGYIGLNIKNSLIPYLSITGSTIVSVFFLLISFTLASNLSWKLLVSNVQDYFINFSYLLSKYFKDGFSFLKNKNNE